MVQARSDLLKADIRLTLTIPLPDGTLYYATSDIITLRVTDEYIEVAPTVSGSIMPIIDVTLPEPVKLAYTLTNNSGDTLSDAYPYILDIYNSLDNTLMASGITLISHDYTIPADYTKKIGTYRFALRDKLGHTGEATLTVRSGPLANATLTPISSSLVVGASSVSILRLMDRTWNLLDASLHSIDIEADGGYFIDTSGNHVTQLHLDALESERLIEFGSDTAGTMQIHVSVDGTVQTTTQVQVYQTAKVILERSSKPTVGSGAIDVRLRVIDTAGKNIS